MAVAPIRKRTPNPHMSRHHVRAASSEPRIDEEAEYLVNLTSKQHVAANIISSDISTFLNRLTQTSSAYNKLMDSLVQFLDPQWERTRRISLVTADIRETLNELTGSLGDVLPQPMRVQMNRFRTVQPLVRKWRERAATLDRKLRTYETYEGNASKQHKAERARVDAETALTIWEDDGRNIKQTFPSINNDGVMACCETWLMLVDMASKLREHLLPCFVELGGGVSQLYDEARGGCLPPWTKHYHPGPNSRSASEIDFSRRSAVEAVRQKGRRTLSLTSLNGGNSGDQTPTYNRYSTGSNWRTGRRSSYDWTQSNPDSGPRRLSTGRPYSYQYSTSVAGSDRHRSVPYDSHFADDNLQPEVIRTVQARPNYAGNRTSAYGRRPDHASYNSYQEPPRRNTIILVHENPNNYTGPGGLVGSFARFDPESGTEAIPEGPLPLRDRTPNGVQGDVTPTDKRPHVILIKDPPARNRPSPPMRDSTYHPPSVLYSVVERESENRQSNGFYYN
ncbi:unnamed protein product [Calicophoron daubneyi]|uniref:Uncharacterized protein n=1 Tax=Calicophoron daubneyi TaxID=300641 RepID=A0AAV2TGF0_CALDB